MDNNIKLISGKEYTLSHLFSGKNKIIIPDLQRDYCWGDKAWDKDANKYQELVSGFLDNLLTSFLENNEKKLTLGLIYGYENPRYHIQLCDGQQRITTLFLILGIINKKTDNKFINTLISKEELHDDDKEPYLQYAIRETTLYFLSDLVCEFFQESETPTEQIKSQPWYFSEYELDASIQSMLSALKTIDNQITDFKKSNPQFEIRAFGNFLIHDLQLLYYDLGNRTRGEETFVVINTTGEPLTATENLKPIILGNIKDSGKQKKASIEWEDREEWFWKNRRSPKEQTSDDAMNDFFIWYWQIRLLQEKSWKNNNSYELNPRELFTNKPKVDETNKENTELSKWENSVKTDVIQDYFLALQNLINLSNEPKNKKVLNTIKKVVSEPFSLTWFRSIKKEDQTQLILPLIAYLQKFKTPKLFNPFLRRIRKNYFDKIRARKNYLDGDQLQNNVVDWRYIIQIIEKSKDEADILRFKTKENENNFKTTSSVPLNEWYNSDEKNKDILKINHRETVEMWEDHEELYGDLSVLWLANGTKEIKFEKIQQYFELFKTLSDCLIKNGSIDKPQLSNHFRLFKNLNLTSYPTIGHIDYCSGMKGAWFSWRDLNDKNFFEYLHEKNFYSLLETSNPDSLLAEIKSRIRQSLNYDSFDITDETFSSEKHLKAWLILKVLYAEKQGVLLSFHDGRGTENGTGNGLASYDLSHRNKLIKEIPFSLANSICGYAVKRVSRIDYTTSEHWSKPYAFDTIIGDSISIDEFRERENTSIGSDKIELINSVIDKLVSDFLSAPAH